MTESSPDDLAAWSLHCFCITARRTPHSLVRLDTNGRLLLAARHGTSRALLRDGGLLLADSQLVLLRDAGLLAMEGDRVRTAFPILAADAIEPVRTALRSEAARLVAAWDGDLAAIHRLLADRNFRDHAFAIVFGHVLDGMLWTLLRYRRAIPETALTLERPDWRGAFWALWPPRQGSAGTNELRTDAARLVMTWTPATASAFDAIVQDSRLAEEVLAAGRRVVRGAAEIQLANLQGGTPEHAFRVPAIRTGLDGPLAQAGGRMVLAVEAALASASDLQLALLHAGVADHRVATVILGHELIWEIADILVAQQKVHLPPAAAAPGAPSALSDLMFLAVDG